MTDFSAARRNTTPRMLMADIRYHLDENVHAAVAVGLRRRGIDVTTTADANLMHASDEEQLLYARNQTRVIVTQDKDFLKIAAQNADHAGITIVRPGRRVIGPTVLALAKLHRSRSAEEMIGRVEFLTNIR